MRAIVVSILRDPKAKGGVLAALLLVAMGFAAASPNLTAAEMALSSPREAVSGQQNMPPDAAGAEAAFLWDATDAANLALSAYMQDQQLNTFQTIMQAFEQAVQKVAALSGGTPSGQQSLQAPAQAPTLSNASATIRGTADRLVQAATAAYGRDPGNYLLVNGHVGSLKDTVRGLLPNDPENVWDLACWRAGLDPSSPSANETMLPTGPGGALLSFRCPPGWCAHRGGCIPCSS
jgi:hypothetical protein